jgi:hypothetical protein
VEGDDEEELGERGIEDRRLPGLLPAPVLDELADVGLDEVAELGDVLAQLE